MNNINFRFEDDYASHLWIYEEASYKVALIVDKDPVIVVTDGSGMNKIANKDLIKIEDALVKASKNTFDYKEIYNKHFELSKEVINNKEVIYLEAYRLTFEIVKLLKDDGALPTYCLVRHEVLEKGGIRSTMVVLTKEQHDEVVKYIMKTK